MGLEFPAIVSSKVSRRAQDHLHKSRVRKSGVTTYSDGLVRVNSIPGGW